jgi:hypothetical protein
MTAACDNKLLLEIVNLRTVSYEAAVPQKAQSALADSPYGEMHWDIDIESLRTAADIEGLSSSDLAKLVLFKYPDTKFIELGPNNAQSILDDSPRTSYTIVVTLDAEVESTRPTFKDYQNIAMTKVDLADISASIKTDSYGVLLVDKNIGSILRLRTILKSGGYIFADSVDDIPDKILDQFDFVAKNNQGTVMLKERTKDTHDLSAVPSQAKPTMQLVYRTRPTAIISLVKSALETCGWHVEINSLESCSQSGFIADRVIILADFEGPLLFTITSSEFERIQDIISSTSSLLWVTPGGLLEGKQPDFAMVTGLARTITSEQASLDFRTIDFDMDNVSIEQAAMSITKVAQDQLATDEKISDKEY